MGLARCAAGAAGSAVAVAVANRFLAADDVLPEDEIDAMARDACGHHGDHCPALHGYTAIVTGATAGLGKELCSQLLGMGANVVLVSRSKAKLELTVAELRARHLGSAGKLDFEVADLSDLEATGKAAANLAARYETIDLLVNNAGIHYSSDVFRLWLPLVSPQGYDMAFSANYLGHFLLTQVLGGRLRATPSARVLNVTSTYHWHTSGGALWPVPTGGKLPEMPRAARGGLPAYQVLSKFRHLNNSYGNTKLAQILHARALQRAWGDSATGPRIVCACPGWARTEILPGGLIGKFMSGFAFSTSAALNSLLGAIFLPVGELAGKGDFVANSKLVSLVGPRWHLASWLSSKLTLRDYLTHVLAFVMLLFQRLTKGRFIQRTSPESYDTKLQDALYEWSTRAVAPYVPH